MRLLLDAHISGRVVGRHLRDQGHDVRALDEHHELEGLDDTAVLELATREGRMLVSHNVHDFPDILRDWAEEQRVHAGCMIVVGIQLGEFGVLLRAIDSALDRGPGQDGWVDRAVFVGR